MHHPLVRGVRHFTALVAALVAVLAVAASASLAQSAGPSASSAVVPPWRTIESGTCAPRIPDLCSRVAVAQWHGIPYTPPVDCAGGDAPTRCRLLMDISAPTSGGPWPIVVLAQGGPTPPTVLFHKLFEPFAAALAGQGAVVMVITWREADSFGGGYPTSFEDVACAIGVARQIAPVYGASPERVTLAGFSTGGWPAMVVGMTPTPFTPASGSCDPTSGSLRPDAAVSLDGVIGQVTGQEDGHPYVVGFLGGEQATHPDAWAASDPFDLVKRYPAGPAAIPFLLVHGDHDSIVPPAVSESFQAALAAAGYDSRLLLLPGAGHVDALSRREPIDAIMGIATAG